ncbi:quinolinate synthase, chloroplastic [Rutidosis leptorrhynchoides]|uniref:quinolinate synthase, chloroplastic n=1 Tax=Rutidosis leptorrhynchoides TaxID=125765 RepID=UPI003A9A155A
MATYSSSSSYYFTNKLTNPNPSPFKSTKNFNSVKNSSFPSILISRNPRSTSSCSAVIITPSFTSDHNLSATSKLQNLVSEFNSISEPIDRLKRLIYYAKQLPELEESLKSTANRVMGCTAQVWLDVRMDSDGLMRFSADSDSEVTKGFCSLLISVLDGAKPDEVLAMKSDDLGELNIGGLHGVKVVDSRVNTWHNVLISMQKRTKAILAERDGRFFGEPFPSLVITADGIDAKGSFAEAQARFLFPDDGKVKDLANLLKEKEIGIVAHFYMDPEVQGVLTSAQKLWPHIHISDSLVMADSAVTMAKAGCKFIAVLGVDFMSENVRAILDQAGFPEVGVYRMSDEQISCSLAVAASSPAYMDYLYEASVTSPSLHVVYINTSLETKAHAHELVPTITCTSSNVVPTILQAFAEVPNLNVWYGPDSYMGANIVELLQQMTSMTDEEIVKIHPDHNRNSIKALLPRLHYFKDGTCIVHHLFGHEVVEKINDMYCDAFLTAHFEVPGEMFSLAMEAKRRGMGVVGSTQNILDFIKSRVQESLDRNVDDHLQFVLGTESGMVTSIVAAVRQLLCSPKSSSRVGRVSVEIVFPVSSDSVTTSQTSSTSPKLGELDQVLTMSVLPGVTSGEGCSLHGGCASCPYMKMNSLTSLVKVCSSLPLGKDALMRYEAGRFSLATPKGKSVADVGCEPILHMRHYQATKKLPKKLINQILGADNNESTP